jgi:hypothetical protein
MNVLADRIRSCDFLFLENLTEPSVNSLRIVLLEAKAGSPVNPEQVASQYELPVLRSILTGSRYIEHSPGCGRFELVWETYIAYSVLNESYSNGEADTSVAVSGQRLFVEFSRSQYLDYLSKASFASPDYPGPYRHWAIYCQDHTIDIASQVEPVIREIGPGSTSTQGY